MVLTYGLWVVLVGVVLRCRRHAGVSEMVPAGKAGDDHRDRRERSGMAQYILRRYGLAAWTAWINQPHFLYWELRRCPDSGFSPKCLKILSRNRLRNLRESSPAVLPAESAWAANDFTASFYKLWIMYGFPLPPV